MSTIAPEVLWAQRSSATDESKNLVYLTLKVLDIEEPKIDLTSKGLKFSGSSSDDKNYDLKIEFYDEINVDKSKYSITGSKIIFVLIKKNLSIDYWPRLTKEKVKLHYVHTDFDKWVDEDEQDEKDDVADEDLNALNGMGDQLDFSKLMAGGAGGAGGMPGMPGMPGMGGAGGMPDLSSLMAGMGGAGGEQPDFEAMLAKAKAEAESESSGLEDDEGEEEGEEKTE